MTVRCGKYPTVKIRGRGAGARYDCASTEFCDSLPRYGWPGADVEASKTLKGLSTPDAAPFCVGVPAKFQNSPQACLRNLNLCRRSCAATYTAPLAVSGRWTEAGRKVSGLKCDSEAFHVLAPSWTCPLIFHRIEARSTARRS